ncbi:MAG: hypothetical protein GY781_21150 [Gammaproteobacteria bacterium]|nr:hypothetical protein [Gammaproteobacteria bacterium]
MYEESQAINALSSHIHNFDRWKKDLTRSLKSFRLWLRRNQLYTEQVDQRLSDLINILKDDYVTIAFAGELSRGKTELINAMFFAGYGQRILPSQAGRTTMCPTELFFDRQEQRAYLRLLPIETRKDNKPLSAFRHLTDYWLEQPLNTQSAESMADTLQCVTETKLVSFEEAEELGFNPENLETNNASKQVEIPKWRHALVSFDHPLLKEGLCILDTPGLNALGSEPELTLGLLPRSQAVIFLLAADAGVTASDMQIWEEHISQLKNRPNLGLYAVLNKVDVLWDELSSKKDIEKNVSKVIKTTAKSLGIPRKDVIPVSAQKGLLARVKQDHKLLLKSKLHILEDLLSKAIMKSKEQSIWEKVLSDASMVVNDSIVMLENRRKQLDQQRDEMSKLKDISTINVEKVLEECSKEKQLYQHKMLTLKPSIRLMERQAALLKETLLSDRFQVAIDRAAKKILNSKTTVGMLKGMREFFFCVEAIMVEFCHEAELTNKMAESIYERFQEEHNLEAFSPRTLTAKHSRQELKHIIRDSDQFNRHLKLALSGKHQIVSRFFNTTVSNIRLFFKHTESKLENWTNNILHPLTHQVEDHRRVLDSHMDELKSMQKSGATAKGRLRALNSIIDDLDHELIQCSHTIQLLNQYKPEDKESNILQFKKQQDEEESSHAL